MTPTVNVRADMFGVKLFLDTLEREQNTAAVRALNRAADGARADAVKELRKLYPGLKTSAIRKRIKIERAVRARLQSAARFSSARIPLYGNFGMSGKGQFGVRFKNLPYRIETPEGDVVDSAMLLRAFRNRLTRSGRSAVLARAGKARYPITVLLAPGIGQAAVEKALINAWAVKGRQRFRDEYTRQLELLVNRRAARSPLTFNLSAPL